jgi:hypothetical protein
MEVGYKQSAIEAYFRSLFPGCSIKSRWDFTKQNLMVRVDSPQGQIKHLVSLSAAFEAEIQDILGHDNRSTTHHYLQRISKANREAIEAMERATMRSRLRVEEGAGKKSHQKSHQDEKRSLKVVSDS